MELSWNDGTADKLYLNINGNQVGVSSDPNFNTEARSRQIVFRTLVGNATAILTVKQEPASTLYFEEGYFEEGYFE